MIQYDPSRRPQNQSIKELKEQNKTNAFWCGPTPWHACDCGSSTFQVREFGFPYRCTVCNAEFTDMGTGSS